MTDGLQKIDRALRLVAARYRLGLLRSSEMPAIAMAALEAGFESVEFSVLCCELRPTLSEHGLAFERGLRDCAVVIPSTDDAVTYVLRHELEDIANGVAPPRRGMYQVVNDLYNRYLSKDHCREYAGDQRDLHHLIGAFYSYDDLEEHPTEVSFEGLFGVAAIPALDSQVRKLAEEWLRRNGRNL